METRSCIFLNENGDTTIAWDDSNDEAMTRLIQKKMDEGMTFFVVNRYIPFIKHKIKDSKDVIPERKIVVKDADFNEMINNETVSTYKRNSNDNFETVRNATSAYDAATNHTVAIRQRVGG